MILVLHDTGISFPFHPAGVLHLPSPFCLIPSECNMRKGAQGLVQLQTMILFFFLTICVFNFICHWACLGVGKSEVLYVCPEIPTLGLGVARPIIPIILECNTKQNTIQDLRLLHYFPLYPTSHSPQPAEF